MKRHPRFGRSASRRNQRKLAPTSLTLEPLENRRLLAADLVSVSPLDDATGVPVDSNLVLTFSDNVEAGPGAGRLMIMNAADDSVVEAFDLSSSARVTFDNKTVTIDPTNPLPADAKLYIAIDPGAIRDTSTTKVTGGLFSENFETTHLLDSPLDKPSLNDYALFITGTLDVQTAGDYRFGTANDDGGYLLIDLNGDDVLDPFSNDAVIFDDTTHGVLDVFTETAITLDKGQYKFEYMYFERGGGSSGEAFYAPDPNGDLTAFDPAKFAVIGDASKGIASEDLKATIYKAATDQIGTIQAALDLRDEVLELAEGYPKSAEIDTADVWDTGGQGHYGENNTLPGLDVTDPNPRDYNDALPAGWSKETNYVQSQPVYDGWTQLDKDFWIVQQGDQDRSIWELGQGTVLVMDPDAFDDFTDVPGDLHDLEAYTTLPAIDLTGVTANSLKLDFDSSFRPENPRLNDEHPDWIGQTGLVDVSFDGGTTWENVMLQNQETAGGTGSLQNANEHLSLEIPNPAGGSMLVRFAIVNATNDWWWAVDNIVITGESEGDLYDGIANNRTAWNFQTAAVTPGPDVDFNNDGKIDLSDFGILKENFGTGTDNAHGDANGDAKVDLTDFGLLKENFGKGAAVAAAVPPPDVLYAAAVHAAFSSSSSDGDDGDADPFADDSL